MEAIFAKNLAHIEQRWPALAELLSRQDISSVQAELLEGRESTLLLEGIQLTSRHDRSGEAKMQAEVIADHESEIHLYGTGLGELPTLLLKRPALKKLVVHLLNELHFALLLHLLEQEWLADPKVVLQLASDSKELSLPFLTTPAELYLASERNAKLRDRLVAEIELPYVNSRFDIAEPTKLARIAENRARVAGDPDVRRLFGSRRGEQAIVIATGPSLVKHYARLKALSASANRPLLICVDTAFRPLHEQGIKPDFVVSIDMHIRADMLPLEASEGIGLIYFPLTQPGVLDKWRGPRYAAYSSSPMYAVIRESISRGILFSSGSVLHPATDLAVQMGASNITLLGADFAFLYGETHAGWPAGLLAPSKEGKHWVLNGHGERVPTLLNFRSYLCYLERYISAHPEVSFFNSCKDGALIEGTRFDAEWLS
jgi:Uncharacterized protein conserved in bacteria